MVEIGRRAEEAERLLANPQPAPSPRRLSRRAMLASGAAVVLGGGAVGVSALLRDGTRPVSGAAAPEPSGTSSSTSPTTSIAPIDAPRTRPMEVVLAGSLLLDSMRLSVNGRTVRSVTDLQLPWTTYVDVPAEGTITWRIDYRSPAGELSWSVGIADLWLDPGQRSLTNADNVGYLTGTH